MLGSLLVLFAFIAACGGASGDSRDSVDPIPGLAEADEVPLIETEPDPGDDSFTWTHAYTVQDLPPINVGQPTADFMADAQRDPEEAENLICTGAGGGGSCTERSSPDPDVGGLNYGGPDVLAWTWMGVPDEAAAVQFTDQDGTATWQRPIDRLVIFPDTMADDAECPCRFDAIDAAGVIVASVDLQTGTYIDD